MEKELHLSLVQANIVWEDIAANLTHYTTLCEGIESSDVVILPEMFQTAFTMQPQKVAEQMEGASMEWMAQLAARVNGVVTGSLVIQEGEHFFNRLIWMLPNGTYQYYDKRHLFRMVGEEQVFQAGQKRLLVEWKGWRICPMICYDLRFPVWSRNRNDYDVAIYIANWPNQRSYPWMQLLKARAIENLAYVVGVNRVGHDQDSHYYSGHSCVNNYKGEVQTLLQHKEGLIERHIAYDALQQFRTSFPAWMDADDFEINV